MGSGLGLAAVDFFDSEAIAERVTEVLAHPERFQALREQARRSVVERYDLLTQCLPRQLELVQALCRGDLSPQGL